MLLNGDVCFVSQRRAINRTHKHMLGSDYMGGKKKSDIIAPPEQ